MTAVNECTITDNSDKNTTTNTTDIEEGRKKKEKHYNTIKRLEFAFIVMIIILLGWVVFLTVYYTKYEHEINAQKEALDYVATATINNITTDDVVITYTSTSNETFRQIIYVENDRLLNDDEILEFEYLMESQTTNFSITNDRSLCPGFTACTNGTLIDCVNETILSNCTVTNQNYNEEDDNEENLHITTTATTTATTNTDISNGITLQYAISYTSSFCNVTNYPRIFQNYTNGHIDDILYALKQLNFNITQIEKSAREV
jgi:hypothetical protein